MSMPDNHSKPTLATVASFFRTGILAGVCSPDEAHSWALSVIAASDVPSGEIIEVSWRKPLNDLLDDLRNIGGDVDGASVGNWLLARLGEMPAQTATEISQRLHQAMQIVKHAGLSEDIYYTFDGIEDELNLSLNGIFGHVDDCRDELRSMLAEFTATPFDFR